MGEGMGEQVPLQRLGDKQFDPATAVATVLIKASRSSARQIWRRMGQQLIN